MKTLKFIKGPGYLYDLFIMFVFYFNQELFLSEQVNPNKSAEDTAHFNRILNEIKTVPEDLRVFFQLRENKKSYFTTRYFQEKIEDIFAGYNLKDIQKSLTQHKKVIEDVAVYYFGTQCEELDYDDPLFFRQIGKLICDSEYDPILKNSLYQFFWNPIPTIQVLSNELIAKETILSKIYTDNEEIIIKAQNEVNMDRLTEKLSQNNHKTIDVTSFNDIVLSFCLVHKNCVGTFILEANTVLLLGIDYEDFTNYLLTRGLSSHLEQLGVALSERNRILILEFIFKKEEASVGDIKNLLNISHTNAYYHMTVLVKTGLLKYRNVGKTVYYSIDKDNFKNFCTMLGKYTRNGVNLK